MSPGDGWGAGLRRRQSLSAPLPTFETSGLTLLKRLTLVIDGGLIEHVFYPVFPPDQNAGEVLTLLAAR